MAESKKYAFGIDLGGTTVKLGLFTSDGKLLEKWEIPTRKEDNGKNILPDIAKAVKAKIREKEIDAKEVTGVGIDVPGPVLENGIVNQCVNLGWGVMDVAGILRDLLNGTRVEVCNDANAAALGEQWKGGGQGFRNAIMVTLGTGIGGGVILNGRMLSGTNGAAGEIGHIKVRDNEEEYCGCGKKGCLEQYCSANGITRLGHRYLDKSKKETILPNDDTLSSKLIFDAAKAGDKAALEIVESFGKLLGEALAGVAAVVDPEVFVIGGGVSKAGQIVLDVIEKYYKPAAFHACRNVVFKLAQLGNDAGIYGAVKMLM